MSCKSIGGSPLPDPLKLGVDQGIKNSEMEEAARKIANIPSLLLPVGGNERPVSDLETPLLRSREKE